MFSFGPGSIYELTDKTVMILGPDYWDNVSEINYDTVHDARLAERMQVSKFYQPPVKDGTHLPARIFPDWQVCQNGQCRRLFRYSEYNEKINNYKYRLIGLFKDNNKHSSEKIYRNISDIFCPFCLSNSIKKHFNGSLPDELKSGDKNKILQLKLSECISFRWIQVCSNGHVDDLDFLNMMGVSNDKRDLYELKFRYYGMDLINQMITATHKTDTSKNINRSLARLKTMHPVCNGNLYWRKSRDRYISQNCSEQTRIVQKGDSMVYFADMITSLAIPPYSKSDYNQIRDSIINTIEDIWDDSSLSEVQNARRKLLEVSNIRDKRAFRQIRRIAREIIDELYTVQDEKDENKSLVEELVKKKVTGIGYDDLLAEAQSSMDGDKGGSLGDRFEYLYRIQEYNQLITEKDRQDAQPPFSVRVQKKPDTMRFLRHLVIADDISITYSQKFFRRLATDGKRQQIKSEMDWLPAIQVRGEGIFVDFDIDQLDSWYDKNKRQLDDQFMNISVEDIHSINCTNSRTVSFFYLIHSFAHYLINALSFVSGFNAASMRERLYINAETDDDDISEIYGVLISSSTGDSEASLGGLAYYGFKEKIYELLSNTLFKLKSCSNDPICWQTKPQEGIRNYAACFSCLFLPETSCELRNEFLDRKLLIGDGETGIMGFFSDKGLY